MYASHKRFETPDDSTIVWHYFSLSKFIGLLHSSSLIFSRLDQFDDKGEGRLSQADREYLARYDGLVENIESDKKGIFYANCWNISPSDEYVLWNTYASLKDGIAIKSNIASIKKAMAEDNDHQVYISSVVYYDENTGSSFSASGGDINVLSPGFCKRKYFSAENELRLLILDTGARYENLPPLYVPVKVKLSDLIEEVYVAPKSYPWFKEAISHMLDLYGLTGIAVNRSNI